MKEISFVEAKDLARKLMDDHGLQDWDLEFMDTEGMGGQCCPSHKVTQWSSKRAYEKFLLTNPWKDSDGYWRTRQKIRVSRVWMT
jgi:hypothetical protein